MPDTESDWGNDPGLLNPKLKFYKSLQKSFDKQTISSRLKKQSTESCGASHLNASNGGVESRPKPLKKPCNKSDPSWTETSAKKKHVIGVNRLNASLDLKNDSQNSRHQKAKPQNVRFANTGESPKKQFVIKNRLSNEHCIEEVKPNNVKSIAKNLKHGHKLTNLQIRKKFNNKDKTFHKTHASLPTMKKELLNKKSLIPTKKKEIPRDVALGKGKDFEAKELSDRDLSIDGSEKFSEISSKYEISSTSKCNFIGNDLQDASHFKKKGTTCATSHKSSHLKSEPSFRKVFIRKSKLNAKKQASATEEEAKRTVGKHNKKAVEEWLSNHYLPLDQVCTPFSQDKNKISKCFTSPQSSQVKLKMSENDSKEIRIVTNNKHSGNETTALQDGKEQILDGKVECGGGDVQLSAPTLTCSPAEKRSKISAKGPSMEILSGEILDQYKANEKSEEKGETKVKVRENVLEEGKELNADPGVSGTSRTMDEVESNSINHDEDKIQRSDKKITFSEVKTKMKPLCLQNSVLNRDRLLKDVSSNVEDFQNKKITFSVVDLNSEPTVEKANVGIATNLSRISLKESDISTSSSFIRKFNDAIERSYIEKENDSGRNRFGALKRKEKLVYDPEMLKCSPTSSQWSYAVELVNSVLKNTVKHENSHPCFAFHAGNSRDCMLSQFHTNTIKFSALSGSVPDNSKIPHAVNNEFSIWKNNNNTNSEFRNSYSISQDNIHTFHDDFTDYQMNRARQIEPFSYQTHAWPEFRDPEISNMECPEHQGNYFNPHPYDDCIQWNGGLTTFQMSHDVVKSCIEDCHTVCPLPARIVENMHESFPDFPGFHSEDHSGPSLDSCPRNCATYFSQDQKWNPNPQNKRELHKVPRAEHVDDLPGCTSFFNSARDDESRSGKRVNHRRRIKAENRIRFSVVGGNRPRQALRHLNDSNLTYCCREFSCGSDAESQVDRFSASHNKRVDRLKIDQASKSSSRSSISYSNPKHYGSFNLESHIIGNVPSRAEPNIGRVPSGVKPVSSSMTLSTVKSDSSPCSIPSSIKRKSCHRDMGHNSPRNLHLDCNPRFMMFNQWRAD